MGRLPMLPGNIRQLKLVTNKHSRLFCPSSVTKKKVYIEGMCLWKLENFKMYYNVGMLSASPGDIRLALNSLKLGTNEHSSLFCPSSVTKKSVHIDGRCLWKLENFKMYHSVSRLPASPGNIRLTINSLKLVIIEHSSFFCPIISDKEKKFYNIGSRLSLWPSSCLSLIGSWATSTSGPSSTQPQKN